MEKLHPGAKWSFRISGYVGAIIFLIFFGSFLGPILAAILAAIFGADSLGAIIVIGLILFVLFAAAVIILAEVYARMAYNRWFYEFTQTNLKIEQGVIFKRYSNVPYQRVQNVDIHRGILARMLGFSSVMIQTAGFSGAGRAEGYIPAVSPEGAEKIRDFLMKKITKRGREQGL